MSRDDQPLTVVLDETCAVLLPAVSTFARASIFSRPGGVLTSPQAAAEEMRAALPNTQGSARYVLVGQSYAAFTQLLFAFHWPQSVAGAILVDPSHRLQGEVALRRLAQADVRSSPAIEKFRSMLRGFGPAWEKGCREVSAVTSLGNIPLTVLEAGALAMPDELSATVREAIVRDRHELLLGYAALSKRGRVKIVPGAGHNIVADQPTAVLDAVQEMLTLASSPVP